MSVTALIKCVFNIQYNAQGFSEVYYLQESTFAAAQPVAATLAAWRANCLAEGGIMTWARISFVDRPRNTVAAIDRPIKPRIYAQSQSFSGRIQEPSTALQYRLETADGQWANRLIRGIPDAFVTDMTAAWTGGVGVNLPAALPDITDVALGQADIFQGFLKLLLTTTIYAKKLPGPTAAWDVQAWNRLVYRGVADRQTGRPFGVPRGRSRKRVPAG